MVWGLGFGLLGKAGCVVEGERERGKERLKER
jgi:hypothetical protein